MGPTPAAVSAPPKYPFFSTIRVLAPSLEAAIAAIVPEKPPPIITISNIFIPPLQPFTR